MSSLHKGLHSLLVPGERQGNTEFSSLMSHGSGLRVSGEACCCVAGLCLSCEPGRLLWPVGPSRPAQLCTTCKHGHRSGDNRNINNNVMNRND